MERVAFLIGDTGERINCLLNPASFVVRRLAGVQPRRTIGGETSGRGFSDDPLLLTGGGRTELTLDLLFDVSLGRRPIETSDVRHYTRPLWQLAENLSRDNGLRRPPLVRFVWGKSWNIPGIVAAVAERFEAFAPDGTPKRSWLRLRLLRVDEPDEVAPSPSLDVSSLRLPSNGSTDSQDDLIHQMRGERLDEVASRYYGNPELWRLIAQYNAIRDPLHVPDGTVLRIPPLKNARR